MKKRMFVFAGGCIGAFVGAFIWSLQTPKIWKATPGQLPNSAVVANDYPEDQIPDFIKIDDHRPLDQRKGKMMYMSIDNENGTETRIYPDAVYYDPERNEK